MNRDEVFWATGPTSGAKVWVKIGATSRTAGSRRARRSAEIPGRRLPGLARSSPAPCAPSRPTTWRTSRSVGFDVVTNRPKVAAYRAPGGPISEYAVECVIDELAKKLDLDPVDLRLKNAAKEGTQHAAYGPKFGPIGLVETLKTAKDHPHYSRTARAEAGPRGRLGILVQHRRRDLRPRININEDGTAVSLMAGNAGYRRLAAPRTVHDGGRGALGIELDKVRSRSSPTPARWATPS